jgi:hypothetical protein
MITTILTFLTLFSLNSCQKSSLSQSISYQNVSYQNYSDTVRTISEAEARKNKQAVLFGRIQKFTPWESGKGANHMFWDWEIELEGGGSIPIVSKDKSDGESINFAEYENQNVIVYGMVFFGIVIGSSDPNHQSATGYRIDADGIMMDESKPPKGMLDTCLTWGEVESHFNQTAYVEGKVQEYLAPYDGSKLGESKIFDWEIVTADNYKFPLTAKNPNLDINSYIGKKVIVKAYILNGIIWGEVNTANMTGTRIDAEEISLAPNGEGGAKITLNLNEFNSDGMRERGGEFSSTNYEFCIPATDEAMAEVMAIDPTSGIYKKSKGRSGCSDNEWLVIGSSRQKSFKNVILKLASLDYVRKISETFWE